MNSFKRSTALSWLSLQPSACLDSIRGRPLATVIDVLIEVPLMLLVVRVVNDSKDWYERTGTTERKNA